MADEMIGQEPAARPGLAIPGEDWRFFDRKDSASTAARRHMLAFASLETRLAGPGSARQLACALLAVLADDVESLAGYRARSGGGFDLLFEAGCRQALPASAASVDDIYGPACSGAAAPGGGRGGFGNAGAPAARLGERPAATVLLPLGGAPQQGPGVLLYRLKCADPPASLTALLELAACKVAKVLEQRADQGMLALPCGQEHRHEHIQHMDTATPTLCETVQNARHDERRMLAREVHDQLGQILTAAKIDIRLLQRRLAAAPPPSTADIAAELGAALSSIDLAIAAVQDITALLRPPKLEQGGLVAALRWQAAVLERRAGIECVVEHDPAGYVEPPPFVAGELLRMCQEALTNVLRHAGATRVLIQVVMRNACLLVRICDNGGGIPRARLHDPASHGLRGMRERAASIRASIHVHGRRGRGTMVAIRRRLAFP